MRVLRSNARSHKGVVAHSVSWWEELQPNLFFVELFTNYEMLQCRAKLEHLLLFYFGLIADEF